MSFWKRNLPASRTLLGLAWTLFAVSLNLGRIGLLALGSFGRQSLATIPNNLVSGSGVCSLLRSNYFILATSRRYSSCSQPSPRFPFWKGFPQMCQWLRDNPGSDCQLRWFYFPLPSFRPPGWQTGTLRYTSDRNWSIFLLLAFLRFCEGFTWDRSQFEKDESIGAPWEWSFAEIGVFVQSWLYLKEFRVCLQALHFHSLTIIYL